MRLLLVALATGISAALLGCTADVSPTKGRFDSADKEATPARTDEIKTSSPSDPAPTDPDKHTSQTTSAAATTTQTPATTCREPKNLGAIAGDADGAAISAQGSCSEWLRVQVTESSTGVFASAMKLKATLISPPEADFDLHVYFNRDQNTLECTTEQDKSELPVARQDVVSVSWGEEYTANNSDDQRPVSIEVRAKDPAKCGKGNWVLLLEGNL